MHITYESFHREVGSATRTVFILAVVCFGFAMIAAWLGSPQAVLTFREAAFSVSYAFAILLALLVVSFLLGQVIRWKDRRRQVV